MKKIFNKDFLKAAFGGVAVALLFVLVSVFADKYQTQMQALVADDSILGMAAYVFLTVFAVIIAPVSTLPLVPLASMMWGWVLAGVLSIIGWTVGGQIAFLLARRFGKPLVKKNVSLDKLHGIEERIPKRHLFWTVVFLRMSVPVDVLSYALGLFSRMKSVPYFFATLIGVTPFAFVFAYAGALPLLYQMEALGLALFVMFLAFLKK
ncbi:MAG: VTT domain-containing protein [Parcubacteria group bacterium]|nr:VTT domain-containing protein [Parcubacteria group bacterium]